ncbi:MAG: helix-turn-helix domain-containing protein [Patescibacteria group bacterium]|nr:helix-turn-helix domain-containing protein [Patescibacteria group bacterium]
MEEIDINRISDFNSQLRLKGFYAFQIESSNYLMRSYSRREFYKICIDTGHFIVHYADKSYEVNGTILFFGNPHIPYAWENISPDFYGYACLFSKDYLTFNERTMSLLSSPLFKIGGTPIFALTKEQKHFIETIFQKMIMEQDSEYEFKDELLRNYIQILIHEALRIEPAKHFSTATASNAATRITSVFFDLLERQFPIETPNKPLQLKTPLDFASVLSVHVNHLNRSVKSITGKPTTAHITERIVKEAMLLLKYTNWNVSEIAYSLGFKYPSHFNSLFKKITGATPSEYRKAIV